MFSSSVVSSKLKLKDGILAVLSIPLLLVLLPITFIALMSMALFTFAVAKLYKGKINVQRSKNVVFQAVKGKDYTVTQ